MSEDTASAPDEAPLTLYMLHALGASARSFDRVAARLAGRVRVVGIDLPGFGSEAHSTETDLAHTVAHVEKALAAHEGGRWLLGGHSMGGKITALVASRVLRGEAALFGLAGVVLMAPSPPPRAHGRGAASAHALVGRRRTALR